MSLMKEALSNQITIEHTMIDRYGCHDVLWLRRSATTKDYVGPDDNF